MPRNRPHRPRFVHNLMSPFTGMQLIRCDMFSSESGNCDGGALFVSLNGGTMTQVGSAAFTSNGYTDAVLPGSASTLAGLHAFVLDSAGRAAALREQPAPQWPPGRFSPPYKPPTACAPVKVECSVASMAVR